LGKKREGYGATAVEGVVSKTKGPKKVPQKRGKKKCHPAKRGKIPLGVQKGGGGDNTGGKIFTGGVQCKSRGVEGRWGFSVLRCLTGDPPE